MEESEYRQRINHFDAFIHYLTVPRFRMHAGYIVKPMQAILSQLNIDIKNTITINLTHHTVLLQPKLTKIISES